jgi:hypothetical protein
MPRPFAWDALVPALALFGLAFASRPAQAQGSVSLTPYAGVFVPTKNSFTSLGNDIKRNNSFIGGGRLTLWGRSPLGVEFSAGFAPARVVVAGATINASRKTNVFVGGLKLMFGLSPATSPLGVYIGAGPAIVRRGSDVSNNNQSQTDFGGLVGAGLRLPLGSGIGVRFDAEDYLYGGNFSGSKQFQNDLVLSGGLSLRF